MRNFLFIFSLLCLSSCAIPLTSQEMTPQFDFYDELSANKFKDSIFIRDVTVEGVVGGATPVTPDGYKAALISSFRQADLYSKDEEAKYVLDAVMMGMEQPMFGLNLTAISKADYKILDRQDDSVVFSQEVSVPCTKTFGDAFDAATRLKMASGCSVGENITHVIKVISMEE